MHRTPGKAPRRLADFGNPVVTVLLCALLLSAFALLNGQPFFYEDTTTYIRGANEILRRAVGDTHGTDWASSAPAALRTENAQPSLTSLETRIVLAGRSVYYGAMLLASYVSAGLWFAVFFQAVCVAFVLRLLLVDCLELSPRFTYPVALGLGLLTPLGYFTGLLMPDIYAALTILIVAMVFIFWERMGTPGILGLAAILSFGLVSHTSHIALALVLLLAAAIIVFVAVGAKALHKGPLALVAACIGLAILCEAAFSFAVSHALGQPPLRLPFLTAHVIELGPGLDYLQKHCATAQFAVCAFLDRLPVTWIEFLFSTDPRRGVFAVADPDMKRALSGEQVRFFVQVVWDAPFQVLAGLLKDVVTQVFRFGMMDVAYGPDRWTYFESRLPTATWVSMQQSLAFDNRPMEYVLTAAAHLSALAGAAGIVLYLLRNARASRVRRPDERAGTIRTFLGLVAAGILINAAVCAALASPLDRFQARVIWLVPLLGIVAAASLYRARNKSPDADRPAAP